ncbi:MAG: ribonuclease III domain-containing protein [Anaerobutyricum sp.]|nr:ribonuclease III [Eubacterium sp.]MDY6047536.1 ribonuclease III domain-containing protein [Anaerobutyricum sp.]
MEESLGRIMDHFPLTEQEVRSYSALAFAYIGDSVYDLIIRTMITSKGNNRPNKYHQQVIQYVNANAQTRMMDKIKPLLTEEEKTMFRRGRNAKSISCAKNQSHHDYRIATGFETLIGYLYMTGQMGRIMELVSVGLGITPEHSEMTNETEAEE